ARFAAPRGDRARAQGNRVSDHTGRFPNAVVANIIRVAVVVGTRPEAIKLAPVIQQLRRRSSFETLVVSTGQHREMVEQALSLFSIEPDIDLRIMSPGQTLHDVTARTVERMQAVLRDHSPNWVIVQGDTTTAFAAALAAFYSRIPVAHVEAGLRSGQR